MQIFKLHTILASEVTQTVLLQVDGYGLHTFLFGQTKWDIKWD